MLPVNRSATHRRSVSPPYVDSPVSDDAFPSFVIPRILRFTKLSPTEHAPFSAFCSSPSSPSSTGSTQSLGVTCYDSPDGCHHLPAVTPSPGEASSVTATLAAADYLSIHPLHGDSPFLATHPVTSALALPGLSDKQIATPLPPWLVLSPLHVLSLSGCSAAPGAPAANHHNKEGSSCPSASSRMMEGSWEPSVASKADPDDQDPSIPISGEGGSRSAHAAGALELPCSGTGPEERSALIAYSSGRTSGLRSPQDDRASANQPTPSSSIGSQPRASARSHPSAPLASHPGDPLSSFGSGSPDASRTYSFVPLPGNSVKKRPRRRYDEIERLYRCDFILPTSEQCAKAYGTLNHLNAHIQMQKHGEKKSPNEFKELRKQWRRARRDTDTHEVGRSPDRGVYRTPVMPGTASASRPSLGLHIPSPYEASTPSSSRIGAYTPSHPYSQPDDPTPDIYSGASLPVSVGLGFTVPDAPSPSSAATYASQPLNHPQSPAVTNDISSWPSPYTRYPSDRQYPSPVRPSARRSSSIYDYQPHGDPAFTPRQHEYSHHLAMYASGAHYTAAYDVYSPSLPATGSAGQYPASGGVAPTGTYLPSSHPLGSHPVPSDRFSASDMQDEIGGYAAPVVMTLPMYESPLPEPAISAPLASTYAHGIPRTINMSAAPTLIRGAWRESGDTEDTPAHQSRRHG